jgi:hypothetical protein
MEDGEKPVNEVDSELTDEEFRKMKSIEDQLNESSTTALNEEPVSIIAVIAGMVALFSSAFGVTKAQDMLKKEQKQTQNGNNGTIPQLKLEKISVMREWVVQEILKKLILLLKL